MFKRDLHIGKSISSGQSVVNPMLTKLRLWPVIQYCMTWASEVPVLGKSLETIGVVLDDTAFHFALTSSGSRR